MSFYNWLLCTSRYPRYHLEIQKATNRKSRCNWSRKHKHGFGYLSTSLVGSAAESIQGSWSWLQQSCFLITNLLIILLPTSSFTSRLSTYRDQLAHSEKIGQNWGFWTCFMSLAPINMMIYKALHLGFFHSIGCLYIYQISLSLFYFNRFEAYWYYVSDC